MREIKFRAWDKHIEVMVEPEDLQLDGSGLVARYYQSCDDEDSIWVTDSISLKEIILLQYTGLKDKNGKEIYEGDIVKARIGTLRTVIWDEDMCGFRFNTGADIEHAVGRWEVIGNIYSNPELLRKV